jgi:hypothetical protein
MQLQILPMRVDRFEGYSMNHLNPDEVGAYLRVGSQGIDLFKKLRDLWPPKSPERAQIEEKIQEAEAALKLSEASLAKALGCALCHCAIPPGIMLSQGFHQKHHDTEVFKCNKCGKQAPPEQHFSQLDSNNRRYEQAINNNEGGWMR